MRKTSVYALSACGKTKDKKYTNLAGRKATDVMGGWVYAALALQMCGMASGQLLTNEGVRRAGEISLENWQKVVFNPFIWSGAAVYVLATVLWLWILSQGEFTGIVPLQSLNMVIVVILGAIIFGEHISTGRWIGIAIMAAGAFLVARG